MKLRTKLFLWLGKEVLDDLDEDLFELKMKTQYLETDGNVHITCSEQFRIINDGESTTE